MVLCVVISCLFVELGEYVIACSVGFGFFLFSGSGTEGGLSSVVSRDVVWASELKLSLPQIHYGNARIQGVGGGRQHSKGRV